MSIKESFFLDTDHVCELPKRKDPFDQEIPPLKKLFLRFLVISEKHPNCHVYWECENDIYFEKNRHINCKTWFVLHPYSRLYCIWQILMIFVYIAFFLTFPFFVENEINLYYRLPLIVVILVNILKNFFTAYVDVELMKTVFDFRTIARKYAKGWFLFDFLSVFPIALVIHDIARISGHPLDTDTVYHMRFLLVLRILSIRLFWVSYSSTLEFFNSNFNTRRIMNFVVSWLLWLHFSACMQSFIPLCVHGSRIREVKESWMNRSDQTSSTPMKASMIRLYFFCLFRTFFMSFTCFETTPETREDMYMTMVVTVVGNCFIFYGIEMTLGIKSWILSPRFKSRIKTGMLEGFMQRRKLTPVLKEKIRLYWSHRMHGMVYEEHKILRMLSPSLREELRQHDQRRLVKESQLLCLLPKELAERIVQRLKPDVYLPNDVIVRAGHVGDCMFLLACGSVAVLSRNGEELAHLADGAFFGELALLSAEERRVTTVVAIEVCEVYRLDRTDFLRLVKPNEAAWNLIERVANERLAHTMLIERAMRKIYAK